MAEPFEYLENHPDKDAPFVDNPSSLYCPECRASGSFHCADPAFCGGMKRMKLRQFERDGSYTELTT